jgi:hypothetical protein
MGQGEMLMTSFLQTWTEGADANRRPGRLAHTASDVFRERGVQPGDRVYVAEVVDGYLELIGRLEVGRIVGYRAAKRELGHNVWPAKDTSSPLPTPALRRRSAGEYGSRCTQSHLPSEDRPDASRWHAGIPADDAEVRRSRPTG